jgi:hypothetical protein
VPFSRPCFASHARRINHSGVMTTENSENSGKPRRCNSS